MSAAIACKLLLFRCASLCAARAAPQRKRVYDVLLIRDSVSLVLAFSPSLPCHALPLVCRQLSA
jgi:hypothetical protein